MASASHRHSARTLRHGGTIAALTASLMLGACGQTLQGSGDLVSATGSNTNIAQAAPASAAKPAQTASAASPTGGISDELLKATDYWGKAYTEHPRELAPALNYARNLKAMGEKRRALAVLQQVSLYHGQDRELASEYGRLALDLDQISAAKQLLALADDPGRPDWRVVSARGAALAKEGDYDNAIPYFERALAIAPDQPSVLSNLALAHAMNGDSGRAETLLRQAAAGDTNSPRIRQNLALVLGLQGKYDEAKVVAARDIPMTRATENTDYLRQVVKLDPKPMPDSAPLPAEWDSGTKIAKAAPSEAPAVTAVPVEKVARVADLPAADAAAAGDTAWVVDTDLPRGAQPANTVLSVSEMAAQFGGESDEPPAKAGGEVWSSHVAQAKR